MRIDRRPLLCLAVLLMVATSTPALAAEPIRVGFLASSTGIFAQAGKEMLEGLRLGLEQAGYQAAGRKIELIEEDDEGNPSKALAKYRKLVEQDRIHVLTGILLANIGYGLLQPIERDQLPSLLLTTPDDMTKRRPSRWIVRTLYSASQPMHPLADYAAKTLKYRAVAAIAMDNPFGYEQIGGFQRVFEESGGKVVQKIWVPLNGLDFAPYLTQIKREADAVCAVFTAGQAVRFVKQYAEQGLKGRLPLIASGPVVDEHILRNIGDEALGVVSSLSWVPTLSSPANRAFVQLAEARLGKTPSIFHASMYSAGRWIVEAAKLTGGKVEDRERFIGALRSASESVADPRGPIKLDEYGNPTQNIYILRIDRVGGKLQSTVIHTYPLVSQFWTYNPGEFLKAPAYSRDYSTAKP